MQIMGRGSTNIRPSFCGRGSSVKGRGQFWRRVPHPPGGACSVGVASLMGVAYRWACPLVWAWPGRVPGGTGGESMAWSRYQLGLAALMLLTGSINTLAAK